MFLRDVIRTAQKRYQCELCGAIIDKDTKYHRKTGNFDGDFYDIQECVTCQKIIKDFCNSNNGGYNAELIREWWQEEKCPTCAFYYPLCSPDKECEYYFSLPEINVTNFMDCPERTITGRCEAGSPCREMTHYCRCEHYYERKTKGD